MNVPLHADWLALWAPELPEGSFRAALTELRRYESRIECSILRTEIGSSVAPEQIERDTKRINDQVAALTEPLVRRMGIAWCAPMLPRSLRPFDGLPGVETNREVLRLVMQFREPSTQATIAVPRSGADLDHEGELCLHAWLDRLPPLDAARIRLRRPRVERRPPDAPADRAALASIVLAQPNIAAAA